MSQRRHRAGWNVGDPVIRVVRHESGRPVYGRRDEIARFYKNGNAVLRGTGSQQYRVSATELRSTQRSGDAFLYMADSYVRFTAEVRAEMEQHRKVASRKRRIRQVIDALTEAERTQPMAVPAGALDAVMSALLPESQS